MNNRFGLVAVIMTILVGVILIGTLLAPTIEGIQKTAGDEITKINDTAILLREAEDGDVLKAAWTEGEWVWTLNDERIEGINDNAIYWNTYVVSDSAYMSGRGSTGWASSLTVFSQNPTRSDTGFGNSQYSDNITVEFGADTITFTGAIASPLTSPITVPYTWAYVVCPEQDATYCSAVSGGIAYVSDVSDLILCGAYTTGDNDCSYTYKDGIATVFGAEYPITVNNSLEIADGTTDIYQDTVTVDIGGEVFTPFRLIVPYEITGHATSGAEYTLYGVVVVLFIVVLFVVAVRSLISRERD